jgi:hypothetical protein
MESGRRFYESREPGIGDYFIESILSDLLKFTPFILDNLQRDVAINGDVGRVAR